MATAYIAYGRPALPAPSGYQGGAGVSIFGLAVASEALTIGGSAVTGAVVGASSKTVAHITADTACYFAVGTTPDPTATAINAAVTSARQYLAAATPVDVPLPAGAKIAVIAVS
ncbi:hypothetical protein [Roseixanthobacter pseudopolyaromaticivorans]|uniref:hypothetical protein n=1 Tax=Xanthobacteraceae TaxID=335928 RepID=UPI0037298AD8